MWIYSHGKHQVTRDLEHKSRGGTIYPGSGPLVAHKSPTPALLFTVVYSGRYRIDYNGEGVLVELGELNEI